MPVTAIWSYCFDFVNTFILKIGKNIDDHIIALEENCLFGGEICKAEINDQITRDPSIATRVQCQNRPYQDKRN
jgi:hypothetical protein